MRNLWRIIWKCQIGECHWRGLNCRGPDAWRRWYILVFVTFFCVGIIAVEVSFQRNSPSTLEAYTAAGVEYKRPCVGSATRACPPRRLCVTIWFHICYDRTAGARTLCLYGRTF